MYSSCQFRCAHILYVVALVTVLFHGAAVAQNDIRLRLELNGFRTFLDEDWQDNIGNLYTGSLELEIPVLPHTMIGLRGYPLFFYPEDDIYGAGAGLALRLYSGRDYDGLFADVGLTGIWHKRFPGDDSKLDPLLEASVGYKFRAMPLHIALRVNHLAVDAIEDNDLNWKKLSDRHSGINALGLGIGLTF